jgi:hypothetical protein
MSKEASSLVGIHHICPKNLIFAEEPAHPKSKEPDNKGKEKLNEGDLGQKGSGDRTEGDPKQEDWKSPPQEWVKINTGAGYCVDFVTFRLYPSLLP